MYRVQIIQNTVLELFYICMTYCMTPTVFHCSYCQWRYWKVGHVFHHVPGINNKKDYFDSRVATLIFNFLISERVKFQTHQFFWSMSNWVSPIIYFRFTLLFFFLLFQVCHRFIFKVSSALLVIVIQLCPTLCDPMDYSPTGSSVHGILQTRILKWGAVKGRSTLRDPIGFLPLCAVSQGLSVPYQFLENRNEQSYSQFSGLRSWERAPAWIPFNDSLQWLSSVTLYLKNYPFCCNWWNFILFNGWVIILLKLHKHAFLQIKYPCFTQDLGPLHPSSHPLQSPGPSLWRPWQVAIPYSRGSSWPRDWISISCTAGRFFIVWDILAHNWHTQLCKFKVVFLVSYRKKNITKTNINFILFSHSLCLRPLCLYLFN